MPSAPWQRCIFHLAQNAGGYASNKVMRKEVNQAVREIYLAKDKAEAKQCLKKVVEQFKNKAEKFCDWLEDTFGRR